MPVIKGTRIPVKLPWKGVTSGEDQFVSMKEPVALALGFDFAEKSELKYETTVYYNERNEKGDVVARKEKKVERYRTPGYRTRSIRVEFGKNPRTGKPVKYKIGSVLVGSFQFPITNSVPIAAVIDFFKTGKGKKLGAKRIVDANSGQGYPVV